MNSEKENIFRTLKEEPLLMTSFLCRIGWHRWLKYEKPVLKENGGVYRYIIQYRTCDSCGLQSMRKEKHILF